MAEHLPVGCAARTRRTARRGRGVRGPLRAVVVLTAAGLLVAGCSSPTETGPVPTTPAGSSPTGWRAAPRDQVLDGGRLTIPVDSLPWTYVLNSPDSGTTDDQRIGSTYVPSFVRVQADGSTVPDPDYVESLAVVSSDPQVVEIAINPAATWSDGTPLTYRDVAGTWQAFRGTDPDYPISSSAVWEDVTAVDRGSDDRHVRLTFGTPNPDWGAALTAIYPTWVTDSPEHLGSAWQHGPFAADGTTFVSAGPFVVTSIDAGAGVLTLGRNPRWWGDPAKLDSIVFRTVSRTTLGRAFANRELDVVDVHGDADVLAAVQGRDDAVVQRADGTVVRQLTLNATGGPLADLRVRTAFAQALDRRVLGTAVLDGVAPAPDPLGSLMFVPGQDGYVDHLAGVLGDGADPDAARATLTSAGCAAGDDGVFVCDGDRLAFRFVVPDETPASSDVAALVRQQEAAAGIDVQIVTVPADDYFSSYVTTQDRDFDVTYFGWEASPWPLASTRAMFYPADSAQNLTGITDPALDGLWAQADSELDPSARLAVAQRIDEAVVGLLATIPLFVEPSVWGSRADLVNFGPALFEHVPWEDVGYTS